MQSAKSIMLNGLQRLAIFSSVLLVSVSVGAQDNSPYARYGLGNLTPTVNSASRAMGGISAAYSDLSGINFSNPASYAGFLAHKEARSGKLQQGRAILDVGIDISNRTLIAPNTPNKFTSSDFLISYVQLGVPLRRNWGLSFGIRPVSRINYRVDRREILKDPITGNVIDSSVTQFRGSGGSFMPSLGTGFGFKISDDSVRNGRLTHTMRFGGSIGYLFGNRETKTLRNLINNVDVYAASDHTTQSSFGDIVFNTGFQYQIEKFNSVKERLTIIRLGASGNWKQDLSASQDRVVRTYGLGNAGEQLEIDSVYEQNDIKGKVTYPGMYTVGALFQLVNKDGTGWMVGADFSQGKWSDYRFFGQKDSVQDNWTVNMGASFTTRPRPGKFFNITTYRLGFFVGEDYIRVDDKMPQFGVTLGAGLLMTNFNAMAARQGQSTTLNLAFEYGRRGNNDNLLRENLFRFSVGLNLNDMWFRKRKYD